MIPTKAWIWAKARRTPGTPPDANTPHRTMVTTVPMIPTKARIWAKARREVRCRMQITPHRTMVTTVPTIPTKLRIWARVHRTPGTVRRMQITPHRITDTTVRTSAIIRRTKVSIHPTAISVLPTLVTKPLITVTTVPTTVIIRRTVSIHRRQFRSPDFGNHTPDYGHHSPDFGYHTLIWGKAPDAGYGSPDANYTSPDGNFSSPDFGLQTPDMDTTVRTTVIIRRTMDSCARTTTSVHRISSIRLRRLRCRIRNARSSHTRCGILRRWGFALGWSGTADGGSEIIEVGGSSANPGRVRKSAWLRNWMGRNSSSVSRTWLPDGMRTGPTPMVGETIGALRHFEQADEDMPGESA